MTIVFVVSNDGGIAHETPANDRTLVRLTAQESLKLGWDNFTVSGMGTQIDFADGAFDRWWAQYLVVEFLFDFPSTGMTLRANRSPRRSSNKVNAKKEHHENLT